METLAAQSLQAIFAEDGDLSKIVDHYTPRKDQIAMADAIEQAIDNNKTIIIEAGTGIGKTFAYLIPALLSGKTVLISTGTKNLQDQLYHKDIPLLKKFLSTNVALLKGRSNYLCHYRLKQAQTDGQFINKQSISDLQSLTKWSQHTKSGDTAEVNDVAEDASIWPMVTSTADNCLGQECPFVQDCFLLKARRRAMTATLVVVNHHLLLADSAIKDDQLGELLPKADITIIDEAHQLPDVATLYFSTHFSSKQVSDLCKDLEVEYIQSAKDNADIIPLIAKCRAAIQDMRLAFPMSAEKGQWQAVRSKHAMDEAINHLLETLEIAINFVDNIAERSEGLQHCVERLQALLVTLKRFIHVDEAEQIYWYETFSKTFRLTISPLSIAERFQAIREQQGGSWIFTSATLTANGRFDYFLSQLQIDNNDCYQFNSPFNYREQAMLYLPRYMRMPNDSNSTTVFIDAILPLLESLQGRTFLLFTSYRALTIAADYLANKTQLTLLVQGDKPKHALIADFKSIPDAVLLGTSSFWEGVDVRGQALSAVMIDKLPFASPGDPLFSARINHLKSQGKNAFYEYQLPQAVLTLKQGIGRLIRDQSDHGILVIADPRLISKSYGEVFFQSMPNLVISRNIAVVDQFIKQNIAKHL